MAVSLNREEVRRRRKIRSRMLIMAFFLFIGLVVLLESPLTRVRRLAVTGNPSIPAKRILTESGLHKGMSLWQINASAVNHAVLSHEPLAESIKVHTDFFQGQVTLQVFEKHVVSIYESGGKFYWLLNDGFVYTRIQGATGYQWPIVTSTPDGPAVVGKPPANPFVPALCQQLSKTSASLLSSTSEIHVDSFGIATIYLDNHFAAQFKADDFAKMMKNVDFAVQYFLQKGYQPGLIDMTGEPPYRYTPFEASAKKGATS